MAVKDDLNYAPADVLFCLWICVHELQVTGRNKNVFPSMHLVMKHLFILQVSLVFGAVQVAEQKVATDFSNSSKGEKIQ